MYPLRMTLSYKGIVLENSREASKLETKIESRE